MQIKKGYYLLFIIVVFLGIGCFRRYEVYGFKTSDIKLEWGTVGAKLIGDKKLVGNTIKIGSPYKLLLWFDSIEPTHKPKNSASPRETYIRNLTAKHQNFRLETVSAAKWGKIGWKRLTEAEYRNRYPF